MGSGMGGWDIIVHVMTGAGPPLTQRRGLFWVNKPLSAAKVSNEDVIAFRIILEIVLSRNACGEKEIN